MLSPDTCSRTYSNENFTLQGIKTKHQGQDLVILRLPKVANVVGRFLISYEEELSRSCTAVDYTTLWAILDDVQDYKPKKKEFQKSEPSIEMLMKRLSKKKDVKKVYKCHSITEDPGNTGVTAVKRKSTTKDDTSIVKTPKRSSSHFNVDDKVIIQQRTDDENDVATTLVKAPTEDVGANDSEIDAIDLFDDPVEESDGADEPGDSQGSQVTDHSYSFNKKSDSPKTTNNDKVQKGVWKVCPHCGTAMTSGFQTHIRNCKGIELMCFKCDVKFRGPNNMEDHLSEKHRNECEFYCQACGRAFISDRRLNEHNLAYHGTTTKCISCDTWFSGSDALTKHKLSCVKNRRYGCKQCSKAFVCPRTLKRHQSTMNHVGFLCRPCDLDFDQSEEYFNHVKEDLKVRHICEQCGKQFKGHIALWKHEKYTHTKTENICHICGWQTNRRDSFKLHMKNHTTGGHICKFCSISCTTQAKLNSHLVQHQASVCFICNFVFLGPMVVRRHLKKDHPEVQLQPLKGSNLSDGQQDESTVDANELPESEENTEGNLKSPDGFKCSGCGLSVRNLEKARLHLDRKPSCREHHYCSYCWTIFPETEALREHESVHTGPYLCFYCKRGFLDWKKCSQHMSEHVKIRGDGKDKQNREKYDEEQQEAQEKAQEIVEAMKLLDS